MEVRSLIRSCNKQWLRLAFTNWALIHSSRKRNQEASVLIKNFFEICFLILFKDSSIG